MSRRRRRRGGRRRRHTSRCRKIDPSPLQFSQTRRRHNIPHCHPQQTNKQTNKTVAPISQPPAEAKPLCGSEHSERLSDYQLQTGVLMDDTFMREIDSSMKGG
jgi:hypothetical protein